MKSKMLKQGGLVAISAVVASLIIGSAIAVPGGRMGDGRGQQGYRKTAAARQGGGKMAGQAGQRASLAKQLNLTQDQQDQIKAIMADHQAEVKSIKESNLTKEDRQARMDTLRQQFRSQITAILTPEQREKAQQMWAKRDGMRQNRQERKQVCLDKLNLTADQKQRIEDIRAAGQAQVQSIKSDAGLSDRARMDRIKEVRKRTHTQVLSVLSAEQQEQMKQCKPGNGQGQGKARVGRNKGMQRHRPVQ